MAVQGSEDGLRFAVLGPVQAWRDGVELDLGTPLQRSILAMLLLRESRAVTPAEMIDAVWGRTPHPVRSVRCAPTSPGCGPYWSPAGLPAPAPSC